MSLLSSTVGLHGSNASLAVLVVLEALLRRFVDGALAGDDLLDGGENAAPVLEDGERHVLARAIGDEICWKSVKSNAVYQGMALLTVALLGEEEIGLAGGGEVRDTIASVEESRALVGGELGVGAESEGLVVAEAAVNNVRKSRSCKTCKW